MCVQMAGLRIAGMFPDGRSSAANRRTYDPSVILTTSDGRTVTRKVEDANNLKGLKVGDVIDITYTRALLTSIERSK